MEVVKSLVGLVLSEIIAFETQTIARFMKREEKTARFMKNS